ncbi:S8 family serine peptidase [Planctobacterium marinum]|uniref:Peptidase S8/S53 domain-containing protein n=1 Tax=Planctobacterium marinum TaxID=1631968 RepID=A0AA48KR90_9ALTE|nr:hypothetical protein MACH26_28140 [Planctobacterium marinum]
MKNSLIFTAILLAAISFKMSAAVPEPTNTSEISVRSENQLVHGYFIVKFRDNSVHQSLMQTPETNALIAKKGRLSADDTAKFNISVPDREYGESALKALPVVVEHIRSMSLSNDLLKIPMKGRTPQQVIQLLMQTGQFKYVEPQRIYYPMDFDAAEYNDNLYINQNYFGNWTEQNRSGSGYAQLRRNTVNNLGRKVRIAVVDTGSYRHEDVDFVDGYDFVSYEGVDENGDAKRVERDSDATDEYTNEDGVTCNSGHGLAVSSIIAAKANNSAGMVGAIDSELVELVPVRSLGCNGGSNVDILESVLWAAGDSIPGVPDIETPVDVVNMSLGGFSNAGCPEWEQEVFDRLKELDVVVVVAAGNENINANGAIPAACADIITVGATDITGDKASFSNYGEKVDIMAQGRNIMTAKLSVDFDNEYASGGGTSYSAPLVAATAAAMRLKHPQLSAEQIEAILKSNTVDNAILDGEQTICGQLGCGTGVLQAQEAIVAIDNVIDNQQYSAAYRYAEYSSEAQAEWVIQMSKYVNACNLVKFTWGGLGTALDGVQYNLFQSQNNGQMVQLETISLPQKLYELPDNTVLGFQTCVSGQCGEIVAMSDENLTPPSVCL